LWGERVGGIGWFPSQPASVRSLELLCCASHVSRVKPHRKWDGQQSSFDDLSKDTMCAMCWSMCSCRSFVCVCRVGVCF
jgi:hypothetical protein